MVADARSFDLGRRFALAIAPMQVVQLLGGPEGRRGDARRVSAHLEPGAVFAAAIADPFEGFDPETALPPLPDVREEDGWVLSSLPVAVRAADDAVEIDRHRQAVSPDGRLTEEVVTIRLDSVDAADAGGRRVVPRASRRSSHGACPRPPTTSEARW